MKNILVPCDFSKKSFAAYKVALELAITNKAALTLLHVFHTQVDLYDPTIPLSYNPIVFGSIKKKALKKFTQMKEEASRLGIKIETEILFGEVVIGVTDFIKKKKIDIVVMGTSGASGLASFFIGSTTEKVVRYSLVPVLTVRKEFPIKSIKNILLPSSLTLNQSDFIKNVKQIQHFFGATIHVLLINTPINFTVDADAKKKFHAFIQKYSLDNYKIYFRNYQTEEDGIIDFARTEKIDLIAMATHGRKGLAHLFNGSIAEDVVNKVTTPIWTYLLK